MNASKTADAMDLIDDVAEQPLVDLAGEIFGRLLVVEAADALGYWWCLCECNEAVVYGARALLGQEAKTCGKCGTRKRGASWPKYPTSTLDRNWQKFSICNQYDPETFYQETPQGIAEAKAICGQCPVRFQCLAWGLDLGDIWGVLGGLSGEERRRLLQGRGVVRRSAATESRLIAAGVEALAKVGGEAALLTRAAVAAAAGMSEVTVKRYFPVIAEMRAAIEAAASGSNVPEGDERE